MSVSAKTLTAATLAFGCAIAIQPSPASAQMRHGGPGFGMRPGMGIHPGMGMRPGFGGAGFGRPFVYPRYGMAGAYRPYWRGGYYPYRSGYPYRYGGYGYPYRYGYGYYGDYWGGGAIAAGLLGGLALGALASPYSYSYPYYPSYYGYTYPGSYYRQAYYAPRRTCFYERRRVLDRHGHRVLRRVHVCY